MIRICQTTTSLALKNHQNTESDATNETWRTQAIINPHAYHRSKVGIVPSTNNEKGTVKERKKEMGMRERETERETERERESKDRKEKRESGSERRKVRDERGRRQKGEEMRKG